MLKKQSKLAESKLADLKTLTDQLIDRDFFLKKKERMLEDLIENSPAPVMIWSLDDQMKFSSFTGKLEGVNIKLGMSIQEFLKTDDENNILLKEIKSVFNGKNTGVLVHKNSKFYCTNLTPLHDYHNKVVGVCGTTWDLTLMLETSNHFQDLIEKGEMKNELYRKIGTSSISDYIKKQRKS